MTILDEQINALKKSALFNLSLGSKELFHSNFLAWFIEVFPQEGLVLANQMIGEVFFNTDLPMIEVRREEKNIDLQIICSEKRLIIENKVKSIPYAGQLDKYSKEFSSDANVRFVLLSLTKPTFFKDRRYMTPAGHIWQWVDYRMLADELKHLMLDGYNGQVAQDYARFIQSLHEIAQGAETFFRETSDFLDYSLYERLKTIRLHDLFDKWRFAWLGQRLQALLENGCRPKIHSNMTRSIGLLEVGFVSADEKIKVGVQLQGTALRQFLWASTADLAASCAKKLIDRNLWFTKDGKALAGRRGKDEFCSYSGTFLYRHEALTEKLKADDLCQRIIEMLDPAKNALAACEKRNEIL